MAKKLSPSALKREDKLYSQKKRVDLGEYYIDVDVRFRPTKIKTMIAEVQDRLIQCAEEEFDTSEISMLDFVMFYVIKHFTNLPISNDFSDELEVFNFLIDSQYYAPICESFDEKELEKVWERINSVMTMMEDIEKKQNVLKKQFTEVELENADILM